jgi:hypothetical protein
MAPAAHFRGRPDRKAEHRRYPQDGLLLADAHKRLGDLGLHGRDDLLAMVERQCWNEDTKAV